MQSNHRLGTKLTTDLFWILSQIILHILSGKHEYKSVVAQLVVFIQGFVHYLQANPMKLALRIKKIRDDISTLKEQCREVLMAKQVSCCLYLFQIGIDLRKHTHLTCKTSCSVLTNFFVQELVLELQNFTYMSKNK